jgi:hypothetical protein
MARSLEERLRDMRQAAVDLRDFIADMETAAFHALPPADRMGFRAIKNALSELGESGKVDPGRDPSPVSRCGLERLCRTSGFDGASVFRNRYTNAVANYS